MIAAPASRRWLVVIGVALLLRFVLAAVLLGTDLIEHNGWYFPNDDQVFFYGLAHALAHGSVATAPTTIGYSLFLVPFAAATDFVLQAVPAVAVVQLLLAVPAAALIYVAGSRLTDRRSAAVGTALWAASPVLLLWIFLPSYSGPFDEGPDWLGLNIGVDHGAALLGAALLVAAAGARTDASARRGLLIGLLGGLEFLLKPPNTIMLAAALVALAVWRRWRSLAAAAAAGLVASAPQFAYNHRLYGNFTTFAYSHEFERWNLVSLSYLPRTFGKFILRNYTGPLLPAAVALALVVAWRRFSDARWLVVGQAVALTLFLSTVYYSISGNFIRYLDPVMPLFCLAAGAALVGRPEARRPHAVRAPGRITAALGAVATVGLLALAVWIAGAPPVNANPTVSSMHPVARVEGRRVLLSWREPSAPANLTYQIVRSAHPPEPPVFGFNRGKDETRRAVGTPSGPTAVDRPPPGSWWYRIAIRPYRSAHHWTPSVTFGYSPAVHVVVPG